MGNAGVCVCALTLFKERESKRKKFGTHVLFVRTCVCMRVCLFFNQVFTRLEFECVKFSAQWASPPSSVNKE